MLTLTPTLTAAQQQPARLPVVRCIIADQPIEAPRLTWATLYTGTEPDYYCGAAICSDGSIVRVRSDSTGNLYRQRITDPSQAGQWQAWALARSGVSTGCQVAAAGPGNGVVRLYAVEGAPGSRQVIACESIDHGQTWGAWEVASTPPAGSEVRALAAAGDWVVYAVDPQGTDPDDYLCAVRKVGGSWQGPWVASARYASINTAGIALEGDQLRAAFYCEDNLELRTASFDTVSLAWAEGTALLKAGAGSGYSYLFPWMLAPDGDLPRYVYLYREYYNGSPAHGRRMMAITPCRDYLAEAIPLPSTSLMQAVLLRGGGYWYLLDSREAYRAPIYTGGPTERMDASARVVRLEMQEGSDGAQPLPGGRLSLWLDNTDGALGQAGTPGTTCAALREGSQVALALGYQTSGGEEYGWQPPMWIDCICFEDGLDREGVSRLRVDCIGPVEYLGRARAHRQEVFAGQSLGAILQRVWWRVCGKTDAPATAGLAATVPQLAFQPGESFTSVALRICRRAGVGLAFRTAPGAETGFDSVQPVVTEIGTGVAAYSYSPGAHPVLRGSYRQGGQVASHVEVFGSGAFGEQLDATRIREMGRDTVLKVVDREAGDNAGAAEVALYRLRWEQMARHSGWIETWANVGQEVGDVVAITDARAGLDSALRRVVGITTRYDREQGLLQQRLWLAGV